MPSDDHKPELSDEDEHDRKEQELMDILLKEGTKERATEEAKKAVAYCQMCANDYDYWFRFNEKRWIRLQATAIIAGVIATLAAIISFPMSDDFLKTYLGQFVHSLSWVRAISAAVATIAASLLGAFSYREDAVRHEVTGKAALLFT